MIPAMTTGARLSFVVAELEGEVMRPVTRWDRKKAKLVQELVKQPAGYMVYFPRGHAMRCKDRKMLKRYGFHKQPVIINMQGLQNPNSPIGKLMMSQDEEVRRQGYRDMEQMVIDLVTASSGPVQMPEQLPEAKRHLLPTFGDEDDE